MIRALTILLVVAATPAFADNHLILRRDGERLVIIDGRSREVLASAAAAAANRVVIRGAAGKHNDTLTIDLTQPISLPGGIDYDGGAAGWDTLVLQGGAAWEQRVTQLTPHDGVLDIDGLVIRYTNLEPITDTAPAANYTVVGTAGFDQVTISDGPGGTTTISSPTFESVTFANKTNVVFDGLGGGDSLGFNNPNPATGLTSFIVTNVGIVSQSAPVAYPSLGINATSFVSLQTTGNDVDRIEITTQTGFIIYHDSNDLTIGGVSPALAGARVVQSGHVGVGALSGSLVLNDTDAPEIVKAGALSGDVGLFASGATSDLSVTVDRHAAIAPAGSVSMSSHRNILLGTGGPAFANDVRAASGVTMTVLGTLMMGGLTTVMSDAFGQNTAGKVLMFLGNLLQTGGAKIVAGGTAGADAQVWSGTGEFQLLGTVPGVESVSGDVSILSTGVTIAPTSGITAPAGHAEIIGHGMRLGTIVDTPGTPVELSDAELDRISAPLVVIMASGVFPAVEVTQPITFTTGQELLLRAPQYVDGTGLGSITAPVLTFEIPASGSMLWTITPTSIQTGPGGPVPYSGVATLNARARVLSPDWAFPSTAEDTFLVTPSPTTAINIDGYLPTPPATPGDILDFDLAGVTFPVLSATFTPTGHQGSLTSANRQPVTFQNIEQLIDAPVNLGVTKTDGMTTAVAGTPVSYTITVTNPAPIPVNATPFADAFPAELTGISWTCTPSAASTCTGAGNGNINDVVTLAANGSVTYSVTATISPSATGTLTNTATVTTPAGYTEIDSSNNLATDTTELTAEANLLVTKSANLANLNAGEEVTYAITLRNAGPSDAQNVTLSDALPANTVFVSLDAPVEYSCATPAVGATGTVTCSRATLPPSATPDEFTLIVRVSAMAAPRDTITNNVTATSATTDPSPANNATAAVLIRDTVPTLSAMMLWLLASLLAVVAMRAVR